MSWLKVGDVVKRVFRSKQESDETPYRLARYEVIEVRRHRRVVVRLLPDSCMGSRHREWNMTEDILKKVKQ